MSQTIRAKKYYLLCIATYLLKMFIIVNLIVWWSIKIFHKKPNIVLYSNLTSTLVLNLLTYVPTYYLCTYLLPMYLPTTHVSTYYPCTYLIPLYLPTTYVPTYYPCTYLIPLYLPNTFVLTYYLCTYRLPMYLPATFVPTYYLCTYLTYVWIKTGTQLTTQLFLSVKKGHLLSFAMSKFAQLLS